MLEGAAISDGAVGGMRHAYQLIDSAGHEERGGDGALSGVENSVEAEFVASLFMYLRAAGHEAGRIAIVALHEAQAAKLRHVVRARTSHQAKFYGEPLFVGTADELQGVECDIVLLSTACSRALDRTALDLRRLASALSRARRGAYVFGRRALLEQSFELSASMFVLLQLPSVLQVVNDDAQTARKAGASAKHLDITDGDRLAKIVAAMERKRGN